MFRPLETELDNFSGRPPSRTRAPVCTHSSGGDQTGHTMDLQGRILHIPLDTFMTEFVPGPDIPPGTIIDTFDHSLFEREGPNMNNDLCKVMNSVLNSTLPRQGHPRFEAKNMYDCTDKQKHSKLCTGVFYPCYDRTKRTSTIDTNLAEARTWSWVSLIVNVKSNKKDSPFVVPKRLKREAGLKSDPSAQVSDSGSPDSLLPPPTTPALPLPVMTTVTESIPRSVTAGLSTEKFFNLDTECGQQTMGKMVEYVSRVLDQQFILFFFSIFICCDHAWLLQWDRAGVVVSDPFNFFDQPQLLHRFIYRFARLDDVQRGRDLTVNLASQDKIQLEGVNWSGYKGNERTCEGTAEGPVRHMGEQRKEQLL
ncbi:hypothetical protein C8Q72DRAFT_956425 [Fomitopsis betulina]|nr:hypothetical protein C8Q72DRAFT_956425 [Fomitopsis betulina]